MTSLCALSESQCAACVCPMSAGDFPLAIETLVTAISLIKQSKIAADDRCKILISSLQDTLHGIESKSYGSKYESVSCSLLGISCHAHIDYCVVITDSEKIVVMFDTVLQ